MLIASIYDTAACDPDRKAIRIDDHVVSYGRFARLIEAGRRALCALGFGPDNQAVVCAGHDADRWTMMLAARAAGLDTFCTSALSSALDLRLGAQAILLDVEGANPSFQTIADAHGLRMVQLARSSFEMANRIEPAELVAPSLCGGHFLLTSGTTGRYKRILVKGDAEAIRLKRVRTSCGFTPLSAISVAGLGAWTAAGHNRPAAVWSAGGSVAFLSEDRLIEYAERGCVSDITCTPEIAERIYAANATRSHPVEGLSLNFVGSSPTWDLVRRLKECICERVMVELGSTEAGTIARTDICCLEDLRSHDLIPGRAVRILDEQGNDAAHGQSGRLMIKIVDGDSCRYEDDESLSRDVFKEGWFQSGDLARIAPSGRLEMLGRIDDVISFQGVKLATLPLEEEIVRRTKASGACVLGSVGLGHGDEVHVFLEGLAGQDPASFSELAALFPGFVRCMIHVRQALPRNHMGKIDRITLRRELQDFDRASLR
jgi:acyl-coenzyme A synthetase/AMP-(fatty) acid ligase